jgi:hypothetical protein
LPDPATAQTCGPGQAVLKRISKNVFRRSEFLERFKWKSGTQAAMASSSMTNRWEKSEKMKAIRIVNASPQGRSALPLC